MKNYKQKLIVFFLIFLVFSLFYNTSLGAFHLSFEQIKNAFSNPKAHQIAHEVLIAIRIPRVILSALVGIGFGISGALMQSLFKNPLADPSLIGISAGASAGVAIFILGSNLVPNSFKFLDFLSTIGLPFSAFLGAVISILLIYRLSCFNSKLDVSTMLLAGIAINALLGALVGLFAYLSTDEQLKSFTFWTMGSLANASNSNNLILLPIILALILFSFKKVPELNLMLLGEDEAKNAGVNTKKLKKYIIIFVSLTIGVSVAFCGIIAFVGLVVPHISRMLIGSNHKFLIPLCAILGALVMVYSDSLARIVISPAELPLGIVTAILGAPFFFWLLLKNKKEALF